MEQSERRKAQGWSIDKRISIVGIANLITFVVLALAAYFAMDKRVTLLEAFQIQQEKTDTRQDIERAVAIGRVEHALDQLRESVDRAVDNRRNKQ
jgi:hypothetical protein